MTAPDRRLPRRSVCDQLWEPGAGWVTLVLIALAIPSSRFNLFSGIPLEGRVEVGALLLVLPFLASRSLRSLYARRIRRTPRLRAALGSLPFVMIGLKAGILWLGTPEGFVARYECPLSKPGAGKVERSWSEPFRDGMTRRDRTLRFEPDEWDLSFFNSTRFNFYEWVAGLPSRRQLPFAVRWSGPVVLGEGSVLEVTYRGEGRLALGPDRVELPRRYGPAETVRIRLTAPASWLEAEFSFDDGYRTGSLVPPGPYAALSIDVVSPGGARRPLTSGPGGMAGRVAAAVVDGAGVALCSAFAWFLLGFLVREGKWTLLLAALAAVPLALGLPFVPPRYADGRYFLLFPAYLLVAVNVLRRPGRRRLLVAWLAVAALAIVAASAVFPRFSAVRYRAGGTDWLTNESLARTMLETRSLEGGEPTFYYQPAFRYVRFAQRLTLGDGEGAVLAVSLSGLWFAPLVLLAVSRPRPHPVAWIATGALAGLAWAPDLVTCVLEGASEPPTWAALPVTYAFVWVPGGRGRALAGTILAAVSGLTRPNQLPAWLGTTSVALGGRRDLARRTKIVAALAFAGLLALPLLHNLRYGHEAVLLTTSGRIPDNLVLPGGVWMRFFTDPDARSRCLDQLLALAFVWKRHFARSVVSRAAIHACQLSWIACGVWMLRRRQRPGVADWALWASPLLFFAPHLFYVILDYTPRHLVVGYVAMASAVLLLTGRTFRGPAPGPPAGPAPSRLR